MRPYDQELQICKRYYRKIGGAATADIGIQGYNVATSAIQSTLSLDPIMRAAPTITVSGAFVSSNAGAPTLLSGVTCWSFAVAAVATGFLQYFSNGGSFAIDARL
jgi:hypothetical protein